MGPVAPIFLFMKETWNDSELPLKKKILLALKVYNGTCKLQKFRLSTIFVYNIAYYPFLITMIYSVRKVISCPEMANASFAHITVFYIIFV